MRNNYSYKILTIGANCQLNIYRIVNLPPTKVGAWKYAFILLLIHYVAWLSISGDRNPRSCREGRFNWAWKSWTKKGKLTCIKSSRDQYYVRIVSLSNRNQYMIPDGKVVCITTSSMFPRNIYIISRSCIFPSHAKRTIAACWVKTSEIKPANKTSMLLSSIFHRVNSKVKYWNQLQMEKAMDCTQNDQNWLVF